MDRVGWHAIWVTLYPIPESVTVTAALCTVHRRILTTKLFTKWLSDTDCARCFDSYTQMQVEPVRLARRQMNEGPQSKRRESDRKGKYHPSCAREVTNEKSGSFKLFAKKLFLLKLFHLLCGGYLTKITPGDSWVFLSSAYPQPNNQFPVGHLIYIACRCRQLPLDWASPLACYVGPDR